MMGWERIVLTAAGLMALAAPAPAWALGLSVSTVRGGSTIDLGELDGRRTATHEEVTLALTSDVTTQYRLLQELSSPLMNERGELLETSRIAIELDGGASGTLRFGGVAVFEHTPVEIFLSDASGRSDTLRVLYSVPEAEPIASGTYSGAITYTLQTIDQSAVDTKTVPIRLQVRPIVSLTVAPDSFERLAFGRLEPGQASRPVRLGLLSRDNTGIPLEVTQILDGLIINERGDVLPLEAIQVSGQSGGTALAPGALEPRQRVWSAAPETVGTQRIELSYVVTVPDDQAAGLYRGALHFDLAASGVGGSTLGLHVPMELEVLPVLSLSVEPEAGQSLSLYFARLAPGQASDARALRVEVRSNVGQAYEVYQELAHQLISDDGRQLPLDTFVCSTSGDASGRLMMAQDTPVPVGKSSLYQSDEAGRPSEFAIRCRVQIPPDAAAGVYRSSLLVTVTTF